MDTETKPPVVATFQATITIRSTDIDAAPTVADLEDQVAIGLRAYLVGQGVDDAQATVRATRTDR